MSQDEVKKNNCDKEEYPLLFADDEEQKQEELKKRYKRAWNCAREAATLLKRDYKAKKVWVFGSLVDESRFNIWSDIDLAADGIPDSKFYSIYGARG